MNGLFGQMGFSGMDPMFGSPQPPAPAPAPAPAPMGFGDRMMGILGGLGTGIQNYLEDDEKRARLAIALNSMRLNPDPNLARAMQSQMETAQATRLLSAQGNRTATALEAEAARIESTDSSRASQLRSAAEFIRSNPQNSEAAKAGMELLFDTSATQFAPTVSGIQRDPVTGQQYVSITDRNTNEVRRVDIEGAVALTPQQEAELETNRDIRLLDIKTAQERGFAMMDRAESLYGSLNTYYKALEALDQNADSGVIRQFLPAFDEATSSLRQAANSLGIDVINSATFGALSATELRLALSTELDLSLPPQELRKQIEKQIRAKDKLRNELLKSANKLTSGIGYSDYIKEYKFIPMVPPEGIDMLMWSRASATQKQEMLEAIEAGGNP